MSGTSNRSMYQRRRGTPAHFNNSVRRAYDLLRSTLPDLEPNAHLVEEDLIESLSASRNTVRVVLQLLAAQGLVSRGPKVGTTVESSTVIPLDEFMPIGDQGQRDEMTGRVLEALLIPVPAMVGRRLDLERDAPVAMIEGVISEGTTPLALTVCYIPVPTEHHDPLRLNDPDPVAFMEQYLDVCVIRSDAVVSALASDAQTATLLGLQEGAPILFCEDLFRDHLDRPVGLGQVRYRGDKVTMSATAHRRALTDPDLVVH